MCTSLTYRLENGSNALARTMDFEFILDPKAILIPRNKKAKFHYDAVQENSYAFTGLGRDLGEFLFADGINEKGLACAALYFPGYAAYAPKPIEEKINLAPHEIIYWFLSSFASVDEVRKAIESINVVDTVLDLLGLTPPLHWIVTDTTGASIVIEPLASGLEVHENPVGVMTNSPTFDWHITNVRNYIGVQPTQRESVTLDGVTFSPFGQSSGMFGLPGDYTPPSRFIRAVYTKETAQKASNEKDALTAIMHALASVDIPKGSVVTQTGGYDYTQHTSCMFCETSTYYFKTYDNSQICKIDLLEHDLNGSTAQVFEISHEQSLNIVGS